MKINKKLWLSAATVASLAVMCVTNTPPPKQLQEEGGPEPVLNEAQAERILKGLEPIVEPVEPKKDSDN